MSERFRLCALADLGDDEIIQVPNAPGVDGPLAVARSGGEVFCISDTCTHQDASLADGWVEDGCVECPMHESRFNLRTGTPDVAPAKEPVRTFPVEIDDGGVYLAIPVNP